MENEEPLDARGTTSRARFLGGAAGLTGLAFAGGIFTKEAKASTKATAATVKRAYVAGNFALSLDGGKNIGMLKSAQGGQIYAEPVAEPSEGSLYAKKHIGNVKYSDITMQVGLSMPDAFYQWIADSWTFGPQRKNGAVIAADFNLNAVKELDFTNALIQETTIPALDAGAKDAAYLVLKLTPESTHPVKASGKIAVSTSKQQKQWAASNFKLELGKIDATRVSKIDSFTIKQTMAAPTTDLGDVTFPEQALVVSVPPYNLEPGKIDFPNLRVTVAEAYAQTWIDWYEDFVRKGNNSDDYEKSGSIKFLAQDMTTELARVDLFGVGIFNLTDERPLDAGANTISRLVAELYVERMAFVFPGIRST
jgi:phage tail-like protein